MRKIPVFCPQFTDEKIIRYFILLTCHVTILLCSQLFWLWINAGNSKLKESTVKNNLFIFHNDDGVHWDRLKNRDVWGSLTGDHMFRDFLLVVIWILCFLPISSLLGLMYLALFPHHISYAWARMTITSKDAQLSPTLHSPFYWWWKTMW